MSHKLAIDKLKQLISKAYNKKVYILGSGESNTEVECALYLDNIETKSYTGSNPNCIVFLIEGSIYAPLNIKGCGFSIGALVNPISVDDNLLIDPIEREEGDKIAVDFQFISQQYSNTRSTEYIITGAGEIESNNNTL